MKVEVNLQSNPHAIRVWEETPFLSAAIVGMGRRWFSSVAEVSLERPVKTVGPVSRRKAIAHVHEIFERYGLDVKPAVRRAWKDALKRR
jgi:hypothetical protein